MTTEARSNIPEQAGETRPRTSLQESAHPSPAFRPGILQVVPRLVTGGVERGTVEISAALVEAGWRSFVASAGGRMSQEIERHGGTHITLPLASKNPWVIRRNIGRLATIASAHDIDLIHARSRAPAWSALGAARRSGRHFVTTFHNAYGGSSGLKRWYNSVMARGERVIAISEFVAAHVAETYAIGPDRLRLIPRGVDIRRFDPEAISPERLARLAQLWRLPDDLPLIMLPGRLTRWKGQIDFIRAVASAGRTDFCCLFVGSEDGRPAFRRQIETEISRCGLRGMFGFTDDCDDMPAAFMLADVVVSASNRPEGFGRVIIEAQAMGRPVVATDHGGARETIIHGETGWLVPPRDPAALGRAILEALDLGAEARQALAARAISRIRENFSRDLMCARTLTVYGEILFPEEAAPEQL